MGGGVNFAGQLTRRSSPQRDRPRRCEAEREQRPDSRTMSGVKSCQVADSPHRSAHLDRRGCLIGSVRDCLGKGRRPRAGHWTESAGPATGVDDDQPDTRTAPACRSRRRLLDRGLTCSVARSVVSHYTSGTCYRLRMPTSRPLGDSLACDSPAPWPGRPRPGSGRRLQGAVVVAGPGRSSADPPRCDPARCADASGQQGARRPKITQPERLAAEEGL